MHSHRTMYERFSISARPLMNLMYFHTMFSTRKCQIALTYLSQRCFHAYVTVFLLEHNHLGIGTPHTPHDLGTGSLQPSRSLATTAVLAHLSMPHFFNCFRSSLRHVSFGLHGLRLPPGVAQSMSRDFNC